MTGDMPVQLPSFRTAIGDTEIGLVSVSGDGTPDGSFELMVGKDGTVRGFWRQWSFERPLGVIQTIRPPQLYPDWVNPLYFNIQAVMECTPHLATDISGVMHQLIWAVAGVGKFARSDNLLLGRVKMLGDPYTTGWNAGGIYLSWTDLMGWMTEDPAGFVATLDDLPPGTMAGTAQLVEVLDSLRKYVAV